MTALSSAARANRESGILRLARAGGIDLDIDLPRQLGRLHAPALLISIDCRAPPLTARRTATNYCALRLLNRPLSGNSFTWRRSSHDCSSISPSGTLLTLGSLATSAAEARASFETRPSGAPQDE